MENKGGLTDRVETAIRFSEVDALGIVWHGNFVRYLEDGRESFGKSYRLAYLDIYEQGYLAPIVKLDLDYRQQLQYGDEVLIETTWHPCDAAKILFSYRIYRKSDHLLALTARSMQVFLNLDGELELGNPEFYQEWKKEHEHMLEESGK